MTDLATLARHADAVDRYTPSQRLIHWLMAVVILAAIALGLYCARLPAGTPERMALLDIHKSLGLTALVLIVLRLPLRVVYGAPAYRPALSRLNHLAASAVHGVLYLLMIAMPLSGYVASAAGGHPLPWFGLFQWPSVVPVDKVLSQLAGGVHKICVPIIIAMLVLHVLAAIWHRLIRKDGVLARMW